MVALAVGYGLDSVVWRMENTGVTELEVVVQPDIQHISAMALGCGVLAGQCRLETGGHWETEMEQVF